LDELRASEEQAMDTNRAEYENSGQNYDNAPDTDIVRSFSWENNFDSLLEIDDSDAQATAFEDTPPFW
ncbi:4744_t:CDS:1, partial [Paraglomus occultum]